MRVSTHIAEKARKARERAAHHARRAKDAAGKVPRHWWIIFGLLLGVVLAAAVVDWRESARVDGQNYSTPVPCAQLIFTKNVARCEENLLAHFAALHGLDRAPVCGRTNRENYGVIALCREYDEALTEKLYGAALSERGVSVWEPETRVSVNRTLRVKSAYAVDAFHLLCGRVVPTHWTMDGGIITAELIEQVNASCKIVASTPVGTVTSKEFNLTTS